MAGVVGEYRAVRDDLEGGEKENGMSRLLLIKRR